MINKKEIEELIKNNKLSPYFNLEKMPGSNRHEAWFFITALTNLAILDLLDKINNKLDTSKEDGEEEVKKKRGK